MKYPRPIKTIVVTQPWGVYSSIYNRFGFKRHNGTDYRHGKSKIISCPFDGTVVRTGNQPSGGGIFLGVMNVDGDMLLDFLHCEKLLVKEGDAVKEGQPLAIQGNTGFSSGTHSHIQARPAIGWNGQSGAALQWHEAVKNEANNSIDPETLWSTDYAEDIWNLTDQVSILKKIVEILQAIIKRK